MRWAAAGLVMKTVILNNFFSGTFCPLLTGLVRLAHLVLDQGLWEGGGTNGTGRGQYLIWEGWEGVLM